MLFITPFPSQVQNDNIHILVIDDEEEVLKATRDYLVSTFSFMVDTAGSGKEALEKISRNRFDAIIADYIMEDTNGISLLKTIRDDGDDTPVIIFTGKGREDVVIAAFENGADGYVMKGDEIRSQFADLAKKINTLVQNRRMVDSLLEVEGQFKNIYEDSPIAIELYNKDGILIDVNPACCTLFGINSP
ncbi:MAG: response regulator, partial [Methanomicrobiales archaeon]|nr:response regulator [Methanomicrobiales archaeon]